MPPSIQKILPSMGFSGFAMAIKQAVVAKNQNRYSLTKAHFCAPNPSNRRPNENERSSDTPAATDTNPAAKSRGSVCVNKNTAAETTKAHHLCCAIAVCISSATTAKNAPHDMTEMQTTASNTAKIHLGSRPPSSSSVCLTHTKLSLIGRKEGASGRYGVPSP